MYQVIKSEELAAPIEIIHTGAIYTHKKTIRYKAFSQITMYYGTMPIHLAQGKRMNCQISEDALQRLIGNN